MCYSPASYASTEDLKMKAKLFKDRKGTVSHIEQPNFERSCLTEVLPDSLASREHLPGREKGDQTWGARNLQKRQTFSGACGN